MFDHHPATSHRPFKTRNQVMPGKALNKTGNHLVGTLVGLRPVTADCFYDRIILGYVNDRNQDRTRRRVIFIRLRLHDTVVFVHIAVEQPAV